jgi:hypothetical protein
MAHGALESASVQLGPDRLSLRLSLRLADDHLQRIVRFSGELPGPRKSTADRLTSLDARATGSGVYGQRQPSTAVVSSVLARSESHSGPDLPLRRRGVRREE